MFNLSNASTACHLEQSIDSRYLTLAFEFYELNLEQVDYLVSDTISWLNDFLENAFVIAWKVNRRAMSGKKIISLPVTSLLSENGHLSVLLEGYYRSPRVSTITDIRRIRTAMMRQIGSYHSQEFADYWNNLFPNGRCSNGDVRDRIVQLFRQEGFHASKLNSLFDIQGLLTVDAYAHNIELFYGSFSLELSAFFLDDLLDNLSHSLFCYLQRASIGYSKINGRVLLQPYTSAYGSSPYMDYFGHYCDHDDSHMAVNCLPKEWYSTYYLPGVEWANVVSPKARIHLPKDIAQSTPPSNMDITELKSGGLCIRSTKSISRYDTEDALAIKSVVNNALYPGSKTYSINLMFQKAGNTYFWETLPRHNWAIVPVFDHEIKLFGSSIVFQHVVGQTNY